MRWLVVGLLLFATTINYLDRAILGVILPEIRERFHFGLRAYGTIQMVFQLSYGIGSLAGGKMLDRYGTRIGYFIACALWSASAVLSAFAGSTFQIGLYRAGLGLGEAANFPACSKAIAEWFPPEKRASAMGLVNTGANIANIVGPPVFILVALRFGWQMCFAIVGAAGFLWLPVWLYSYRASSPAPQPESKIAAWRLRMVLKSRKAWGFAGAKFFTDPVWWFYLFWLPTYLSDVRHLSPTERGKALTLVYLISGLGSLAGGLSADWLIRRGWNIGRARSITMLCCALTIPLCSLGVIVNNTRLAIVLFGLATASHQAWMANLLTTPSDMFPASALGSVNGFGVSLGAFGGALFSGLIPGFVIPSTGYAPVLVTMSCFYLIAWFLVSGALRETNTPVTAPAISHQAGHRPI